MVATLLIKTNHKWQEHKFSIHPLKAKNTFMTNDNYVDDSVDAY
jgi:hypothetical protein